MGKMKKLMKIAAKAERKSAKKAAKKSKKSNVKVDRSDVHLPSPQRNEDVTVSALSPFQSHRRSLLSGVRKAD